MGLVVSPGFCVTKHKIQTFPCGGKIPAHLHNETNKGEAGEQNICEIY